MTPRRQTAPSTAVDIKAGDWFRLADTRDEFEQARTISRDGVGNTRINATRVLHSSTMVEIEHRGPRMGTYDVAAAAIIAAATTAAWVGVRAIRSLAR